MWEDERRVAEERFPGVEKMMRVLDCLVLGTGEGGEEETEEETEVRMERWKGWAMDDWLDGGEEKEGVELGKE